ncbi:ester cyclase [Dactylosporangium sp. NPDC005572]|uniref:ester cyclase n=1 Tax=Dactylosporangium sp. NPDC005572 TaxID=3156889 RepID=UPI0033A2203A
MSQREQLIRGLYRTMFESGDVTLADRVVTPGFVDHAAPPVPVPAGPDQLRAVVSYLHSVLADIRYEIDDVLHDGDRVAYRAAMSATQIGELFGFPSSGRSFRMQQIHIVRFDGDLIAEHWACRDDLGALRQLGHIA